MMLDTWSRRSILTGLGRAALGAVGAAAGGSVLIACGGTASSLQAQTSIASTSQVSAPRANAASASSAATSSSAVSATSPGAAAAAPAKGKITLRWSTWGDAQNPFAQAATQGLQIFQQQHPEIIVTPEDQGAQNFVDKMTTEMVSGDAPDVIGQCCTTLPNWTRKGLVLPLDAYINRDFKTEQIKDFEQLQWSFFHDPKQGQFAFPMYMGIFALAYNKDRFQATGVAAPTGDWDWQNYQDAMLKLTDPSQQKWGMNSLGNGSTWYQFIHQNGGSPVDPTDDTKCTVDSPAALEATQWLHDRYWVDKSIIPNDKKTAGTTDDQRFKNGTTAMYGLGSWYITRLIKAVGPDMQWDAFPLPKGKVMRSTLATTDGWVIFKGSPHPAEAWTLMKFLQADDWWTINMAVTGQQPARASLQDKWIAQIVKGNPVLADKNLKAFTVANTENYGRAVDLFHDDPPATKVLNDAYLKTVQLNQADVTSTMREAAAQVNQIEQVSSKQGASVGGECACLTTA
jgi:multiple sugar transport system substrate-binding protein